MTDTTMQELLKRNRLREEPRQILLNELHGMSDAELIDLAAKPGDAEAYRALVLEEMTRRGISGAVA